MIRFKISLEVMSRVRAERNETFRGWNKIRKRDTNPVKTNGSKTGISFEKAGNITSTS